MPAHRFSTVLGDCRICWEGEHVSGFGLLTDLPGDDTPPPWIERIAQRVRSHLAGAPEDFANVPYDWPRVTDFQAAVYRAALAVKSGRTATYGDLARALNQPIGVSRAVGVALGQNPWPLLVPCHRFVGADGRMTGFSAPGGIQTKLRLLAIEGSQLFAD